MSAELNLNRPMTFADCWNRIDTLTAQRDEARTALVHLNRAERAAQGAMGRGLRGPDDIAIIDLFDAVCKKAAGLVPDDDWGLVPRGR